MLFVVRVISDLLQPSQASHAVAESRCTGFGAQECLRILCTYLGIFESSEIGTTALSDVITWELVLYLPHPRICAPL